MRSLSIGEETTRLCTDSNKTFDVAAFLLFGILITIKNQANLQCYYDYSLLLCYNNLAYPKDMEEFEISAIVRYEDDLF